MNQLMSLLVVLAAPSVNAMASYMASVPTTMRSLVDSGACSLPEEFFIQNFIAESADGGATLDSFEFGYLNSLTDIDTTCYYNETSVPIDLGGRTPRYVCEDSIVQFIFQDSRLTMIELACPEEDGTADFEAAGTAEIDLVCDDQAEAGENGCKAGSDDIRGQFVSFSPVPPNPGNSTARAI